MKHYTYKITQPSTGFYYIGVRSCQVDPLKDPYMGSMSSWKLTKEEKALCNKEIIAQYDTREEANEDEKFMIIQVKKDWKDPNCKNGHTNKSFCSLGLTVSEKTKAKMSISHIGKTHTKETRIKMSSAAKGESNGFYGKLHSDETRIKMSESKKGKLRGPYKKNKI